jgi:hypothetical protein
MTTSAAATSAAATSAVNFLRKRGISRDAAIAITATLWSESRLNPGSQGDQSTEHGGVLNSKGAYGIASWNGPRQAELAEFAKRKGLAVDMVETQLMFVLTETADHYPAVWKALISSDTYEKIIPIFVADYENPADHAKEAAAALNFAKELDEAVPSQAPPPAPAEPAPPPAPVPPAPAAPSQDEEIAAIEAALAALEPLMPTQRYRVLVYLYNRLAP